MRRPIYGLVEEYSKSFKNILVPKEKFIKSWLNNSDDILECLDELFFEASKSLLENDIAPHKAIALCNYALSQIAAICLTLGVSEEALRIAVLKHYYDLEHSADNREMIYNLKLCFVSAIEITKPENIPQHLSELIEKCTAYIKENIMLPITLNSISETLDYTPVHISHKFSEEMRIGINEYIARQKAEVAKRFLIEMYSVDDVAQMLSYSSTGYFIKVFKRVTGLTPKQYQLWILSKQK